MNGDAAPFVVTPTSGLLQPGQAVAITASLDRASIGGGDPAASVEVSGDGSARTVTLRARIERPPVIGPNHGCVNFAAGTSLFIDASAAIADETPPISATFSAVGSNGLGGSAAMSFDVGTYFGLITLDLDPNDSAMGSWSWTISASDSRGNTASTSGSFQITSC